MLKTSKKLFFFLFVIVFLTNCISVKKTTYLRDLIDTEFSEVSINENYSVLIQPGDVLHIDLFGIQGEQLSLFKRNTNSTSAISNQALNYQGFLVESTGGIDLPVIGRLKVENLTIDSCRQLIQLRVDEYIEGAIVDLRIISFQFSVLGEVIRPGEFESIKERISIFEALAKAGDFNQFGDKTNVMVLRDYNGQKKIISVNLTSSNFMLEEGYWIKPHDVIVVSPVKAKTVFTHSEIIQIVVTSITTLLLFYTYIKL